MINRHTCLFVRTQLLQTILLRLHGDPGVAVQHVLFVSCMQSQSCFSLVTERQLTESSLSSPFLSAAQEKLELLIASVRFLVLLVPSRVSKFSVAFLLLLPAKMANAQKLPMMEHLRSIAPEQPRSQDFLESVCKCLCEHNDLWYPEDLGNLAMDYKMEKSADLTGGQQSFINRAIKKAKLMEKEKEEGEWDDGEKKKGDAIVAHTGAGAEALSQLMNLSGHAEPPVHINTYELLQGV